MASEFIDRFQGPSINIGQWVYLNSPRLHASFQPVIVIGAWAVRGIVLYFIGSNQGHIELFITHYLK